MKIRHLDVVPLGRQTVTVARTGPILYNLATMI